MFAIENIRDNRGEICCWLFALYLLVLAVMDIKKKKIRLSFLLYGFLFIPAVLVCTSQVPVILNAAGGAVGLAFIGVSRVTGESFGYGDSILITIMGSFLGFWNILTLLMTAFGMAAVYSIILLIKNDFKSKDSFPFVPFLAAAYIGGMAVGIY